MQVLVSVSLLKLRNEVYIFFMRTDSLYEVLILYMEGKKIKINKLFLHCSP